MSTPLLIRMLNHEHRFFVRGAGFFTTYINPIGMDQAGWKFLFMVSIPQYRYHQIGQQLISNIKYIAMICCEILTIYFFYPETQGRTLEELAFCKSWSVRVSDEIY
jgi:hypothetical protein